MRRVLFTCACLAALVALPAPALAFSDATEQAARLMAKDALALYDKGDWPGALEELERADALVHAPTLGMMAARCLVKLGRLADALRRYDQVLALKLDAGAPPAQLKAQATARKERDDLSPKVPRVTIELVNAAPNEVEVRLDGKPLPSSAVGVDYAVNPGKHSLQASRGSEEVTAEVTIAPGEAKKVALKLSVVVVAKPVGPVEPPRPAGGGTLRTAGFVVLGVGAVGVVAGAVTGGLAISAKSSLDAVGCPNGHCPPDKLSDVNRYNLFRMISGPSLIAGGVLAAAGTTMLIIGVRRSSGPARTGVTVSPWIGAGAAGLTGAF